MSKIKSKKIRSGILPDADETTLYALKASYTQDGDACGDTEINSLSIETQDGGGGAYFVVKTERFAFENPEELISIIEDFFNRFKDSE